MSSIRITLALLLLLSCVPARAQTPAEQAWANADQQKLWQHQHWLNLLHMSDRPRLFGHGSQSYIRDPRYFLADNGHNNPRAELEATIKALFQPQDSSLPDAHPQCRFVSRLDWLDQQLDLSALSRMDCPAYQDFRKLVQADSATLVFPSYYLNSPSSMFGHTLLRLDTQESHGGGEYIAYAVNFGAEVDASDNSIFYAFKGLTGGYPGQFKVDHYYKKIQEYNRDENRDIWEYELALEADEVERLIKHLWDLRGINFDYYFFDENCSFRILELIEVARPGIELTENFRISAIPVDTVRTVGVEQLIREIDFRPARGTVLRQKIEAIPLSQQAWIERIALNIQSMESPSFQQLEPQTQAQIIEAAYKFLRIKAAKDSGRASAKSSYVLLKALKDRAEFLNASDQEPAYTLSPPTSSHGSRRISLGGLHSDSHTLASFGFRFSLHSLEERPMGFLPGGQINLGNIQLRSRRGKPLDLERFDIVDIVSLTPRDRFFQPLSWSVLLGSEQQWTFKGEALTHHVTGGVGFAKVTTHDSLLYGLGTARLENNAERSSFLHGALGLRLGLLKNWQQTALHLQLDAHKFDTGEQRLQAKLLGHWSLSRDQAVQASWQWRRADHFSDGRIGLQLHHYY